MIPFSACSSIMLGVERPYQMTERRGVVGPPLLSCRRAGGQGQEKASTALSLYNDLLTTAVLGCCRLHQSNIVARSWTRHVLRFLHMSTAAVPRQSPRLPQSRSTWAAGFGRGGRDASRLDETGSHWQMLVPVPSMYLDGNRGGSSGTSSCWADDESGLLAWPRWMGMESWWANGIKDECTQYTQT